MIKKIVRPETEGEIIKNWVYKDKCYVSCIVLTFNQKDYIRDTIDSILGQETEYQFEIIIHDDVSTDGTREILLEYKNKYPSIIKLVLQDENQYSQGKRIAPLAVKHAEGEYIALCEGDDFWIDKNKLQKQILSILDDKKIKLVITRALNLKGDKFDLWKETDYGDNELNFKLDDVLLSHGQFSPTASYFMEKSIITDIDDIFLLSPVGDITYELNASLKGGIRYLPDITCVYRNNALGSWSNKMLTDNNKLLKFNMDNKFFFEKLELYVNDNKYDHCFVERFNTIDLLITKCYLRLGKKDELFDLVVKKKAKVKINFISKNILWLYMRLKFFSYVDFLIKIKSKIK